MEGYLMKDSGVEWLGEIPGHWRYLKLKRNYDVLLGKMIQPEKKREHDQEYQYLRAANLDWNGVKINDIKTMWFQPFEVKKYALIKGDLLVSEGGDIGKCSIWRQELDNCFFQNAINRVRAKQINSTNFLYYWIYYLKHVGFIDSIVNRITIAHLTAEKLEVLPILSCPPEEQKVIANYLDKACKNIDQTIALKQQQLILIEEQYKSKIVEVIRKGLDKQVEQKNSGSKWLGFVPKHWKVTKVKRVTEILRGKFNHRPRNDPAFYNGEYPFIQTGDVSNAKKYITTYSQSLNDKGFAVSKEFPGNTLTMTIAANIGDIAILNFKACFPDSVIGFKPLHMVKVEFLYYMFLGLNQGFLSTAIVTTQLNLNIVRVGTVTCAIPPLFEQDQIVNHLDDLRKKTDSIIENINSQITTLKQYRQSLIHECVTGKKRIYQAVQDTPYSQKGCADA